MQKVELDIPWWMEIRDDLEIRDDMTSPADPDFASASPSRRGDEPTHNCLQPAAVANA